MTNLVALTTHVGVAVGRWVVGATLALIEIAIGIGMVLVTVDMALRVGLPLALAGFVLSRSDLVVTGAQIVLPVVAGLGQIGFGGRALEDLLSGDEHGAEQDLEQGYRRLFGIAPKVTRVEAKTSRLEKLDGSLWSAMAMEINGEPEDGVLIRRQPGPPPAYIVEIRGLKMDSVGSNDGASTFEAFTRSGSPLELAVRRAMDEAGIRPGDRVLLVGHSQGGIVASRVAMSDPRVTDVVTMGSPTDHLPIPARIPSLHLVNDADIVPTLDVRNGDTSSGDRVVLGFEDRDGGKAHHNLPDNYADTLRRLELAEHVDITYGDEQRARSHLEDLTRRYDLDSVGELWRYRFDGQ